MRPKISLTILTLAAVLWAGFSGPARGQVQAMPPSDAANPPILRFVPGPDDPSAPLVPQPIDPGPQVIDPAAPVEIRGQYVDVYSSPSPLPIDNWTWQVLPDGLIYRSYLAAGREPGLRAVFFHDKHGDWLLDAALGARVGILRYGTQDAVRPEGWQLDLEGAAFPRLTFDHDLDVLSTDFRFGIPLTFRQGFVETKFAYAHYSSHLGDEYLLHIDPSAVSDGYSKESMVLGIGLWPIESLRLYGETSWAFHTEGPAKPWEFQFGIEFSPPFPTGIAGAPFFAINTRIAQELDYSGNLAVQTGWQWRGAAGQRLRTGFHYFNGKSDQAQFLNNHEEQIGAGVWYDF